MADAADDRDVAKSVRPVGPQAIPSRSGDAMRRLADLTYPLKPDGERRCLSVGRGITLRPRRQRPKKLSLISRLLEPTTARRRLGADAQVRALPSQKCQRRRLDAGLDSFRRI